MNRKIKEGAGVFVLALAFGAASIGLAHAAGYPEQAIKLVVPYPAGAAVDNIGRLVASELAEKLNQTVIVENRDGAASQIGTAHVAKAKADGYTLLLTTLDALTLLPLVKQALPYDPIQDFTQIAGIARVPYTIQSNPSLAFQSLSDLVKAARAAPGTLRYGSTGNGSLAHVAMEMFATEARIKLIHVPYRGMAASINDLIAGHIDLGIISAATSASYAKAGKIKTLSLVSAQKNAMWPDIPTTTESNIKGVEAGLEFILVSPNGTPGEVVNVLSTALRNASNNEGFREKLRQQGMEPAYQDADALTEHARKDSEKWKKAIEQTHIQKA